MIFNKIFSFTFFLIVVCTPSFAQDSINADSLNQILRQKNLTKEEVFRILSLKSYYHKRADSSLLFAKQALAIAKEINNTILQANAWEEIGHVERSLGNNSIALDASLTALRIYDSLGLKEQTAATYGQLASNSTSDEDYNSAINYLKKAEEIYANSDNRGNLILTKLNLGETHRLAGKLDSAIIYFEETLKRNKTLNNTIVQGYSLGNLGLVLSTQGNFEAAKQHLNEAIEILTPLDDSYSTSVYLGELGDINIKEQNFNLGESKLLEAFNIAHKAGLKEQIKDFSKKLTDFYKDRKHYDKALSYLEVNRKYQDSLVNEVSVKEIEQIKARFQIDKRETEIELINIKTANKKNQMIWLASGLLIFCVLAYMLYRSNKAAKKVNKRVSSQNVIIEKLEQEKAMLLKELRHRKE
ncbi:tetratricopeptide repeat protein [Winogradskyella sp. PE311]|uniref:tetratricopeptide repeat protein n=1 Tax=Winogradskyella sp. PE311 TaxID=3366943 RepID=UPI0039803781